MITRGLKTWVTHMKNNLTVYEDQVENNNEFASKLLYAINTEVQQYLQSLKNNHVPLSTIPTDHVTRNFTSLQSKVITRQLVVDLPHALFTDHKKFFSPGKKRDNDDQQDHHHKKNKQNHNDNYKQRSQGSNNRHKNSSHNNSNPNVKPLNNIRTNPKWLVPTGRTFGECFHEHRDTNKPPMHDGKPFCIQYFISGICKRGTNCKFSYTDPRDTTMETEFNEFCRKGYATNKS